jgi:REP element-mobilizing transposase RayT
MTEPRRVLPASTYLVTRRCTQRQFLLRPSPLVNQVFTFCLAYAASETGVAVHAWCALSNHFHVVLTDPQARLPEFMACLDKLVSKCVNASLGRWESLWSSDHYSAPVLIDDEDVFDKIVYVLANPVAAGLVEPRSDWPGAISGPRACLEAAVEVERPGVYFDPDGEVPPKLNLEVTMPPCFAGMGTGHFAAKLATALRLREETHREKLAQEGRQVLGAEAVLAQDPYDRPDNCEPRRELSPKVACRDKWRRIEALQRVQVFLEAYRAAWDLFKAGLRNVTWPHGAYWFPRIAGCPCAGPG